MFKYMIFCVLFLATFITSSPVEETQNIKIQVLTTEEINDLLKEYPNAVKVLPQKINLLKPAVEEAGSSEPATNVVEKEYVFGKRVSDDFKVGNDARSDSFTIPRNVETILSYPAGGDGRILSFVNVIIRQSSFNGSVWVLSGGIGLRHMKIVIESPSTPYYQHEANFYGF